MGAQKEVGQALQMFESRLAPKTEVQVAHAAVTGPPFTSNAGAAQVPSRCWHQAVSLQAD